MLDFSKYFERFVRIKSIQDDFEGFFQQVGVLIKLVREYKLQKSFKIISSMFTLKSPKKIKSFIN